VALSLPEAGGRSLSGVGHAVPVDSARRIVEQLLAHGRVKRPSMGVVLAPQQVLKALGVDGVLVLEVPAASPAAAAGLRATYRDVFGDVVLGDIIGALALPLPGGWLVLVLLCSWLAGCHVPAHTTLTRLHPSRLPTATPSSTHSGH